MKEVRRLTKQNRQNEPLQYKQNHSGSTTNLLTQPKAHLTLKYDNKNANLTYESMSHPDHKDDTTQIDDTRQIHYVTRAIISSTLNDNHDAVTLYGKRYTR